MQRVWSGKPHQTSMVVNGSSSYVSNEEECGLAPLRSSLQGTCYRNSGQSIITHLIEIPSTYAYLRSAGLVKSFSVRYLHTLSFYICNKVDSLQRRRQCTGLCLEIRK